MAVTTPCLPLTDCAIAKATKNPQVGKELTEHAHRHP